jgi:hypothetical protein
LPCGYTWGILVRQIGGRASWREIKNSKNNPSNWKKCDSAGTPEMMNTAAAKADGLADENHVQGPAKFISYQIPEPLNMNHFILPCIAFPLIFSG